MKKKQTDLPELIYEVLIKIVYTCSKAKIFNTSSRKKSSKTKVIPVKKPYKMVHSTPWRL